MNQPLSRPINEYFAHISAAISALASDPLKNSGVLPVHPVGNGSSGLMLIGEAPGAKEDLMGEPFLGASGRLLNTVLLPSIGLTRETIYLTNIVKCRPPGNRDPTSVEKAAWTPILQQEILSVQPRVIATLGRHALSFFIQKPDIGTLHGTVIPLQFSEFESVLIPLYHPAAALYDPRKKSTLLADFLTISQHLSAHEQSATIS
jgi:uracil-DNA glycosylase